MVQGTLYIISAPSGTGKSSLIQALLKNQLLRNNTQISVSHTTRAPRAEEVHGRHYFFISYDEFKKMIGQGAFIEYAEVFGNYYGTSQENLEKILATGVDVFLDIDWQGAQQIRARMLKTRSVFIFILPPSKKELNRRLRVRDQDNEEIIARRMTKAVAEMSHYTEYDYLIVNEHFEMALKDLKTIIDAERLHISRQKQCYSTLITKLLEE